ncbi:hypothetical protein [Paraherbaspirillum soli]|uniref:Uncharacterized protein n=1 Tax=Paraherbaspirillum soli TaxID=631222 RepID=A0ABW0M5R9_9BURK
MSSSNKASHHPFSWLVEELDLDKSAQLLALTRDFSHGIETCLKLVHASNLAREHDNVDCPPTLDIADSERLLRFSMEAAGVMAMLVGEQIDCLNQQQLDARERKPQD